MPNNCGTRVEEIKSSARANADGYLQAADTIRRGGGPEAITAAVAGDLRDYVPSGIPDVDARERTYYLAVAMADDNRGVARQLREFLEAHKAIHQVAYQAFLALFNRRPATSVTFDGLYYAVSGYLEGVQLYKRYGLAVSDDRITDSMIRIFWAHTRPLTGPEHHPLGEMWGGLNRRA